MRRSTSTSSKRSSNSSPASGWSFTLNIILGKRTTEGPWSSRVSAVRRVSAAKESEHPQSEDVADSTFGDVGCYQDFALAEREKLWGNEPRVRGCVLPRFLAFYFLRVGQRLATAKETA